MKILKVENLCKIYGSGNVKLDALKDVSFSINKGEFVAVVGESGSGKSTLLNCIGGLDNPTSGKVILNDKDIFDMNDEKRTIFRRRNIGFVFQSFNLIQELNVEQNIIFPLLLDYKKADYKRLDELMKILGLDKFRNHLPSQLSGGQQQRVAIGRALITKPMLILADEPTGNLDTKNSKEVLDLLVESSKIYGQTILMITHSMNMVSYADRVLKISDGILEDLGGASNEKLS
ncbi:MAG: ABC transporter ATP-binding protein [Clostridioides sp.]|nr:ABC transporter ATP-binding protein [Clostridioides sp.]